MGGGGGGREGLEWEGGGGSMEHFSLSCKVVEVNKAFNEQKSDVSVRKPTQHYR